MVDAEDPTGGGEPTDSGASRTGFDLGDGSEWVDGGSVDWQALVAYLFTIAALIYSEVLARAVSGLFSLPRRAVEAVGDVYARLASEIVGFWPTIFSTSFDSAATSIPDFGVASFLVSVVFVVVWLVVINEVLEVL